MRCPKCGFISFDNMDSCLKCNKNISEATKAFQGSILKVTTPSFLKIPTPTEDDIQIEGAAEVGGEIEFTDPDLEILIDEEEEQGDIDFQLGSGEDGEDDLPLAGDFDEAATFGDEEDDIDLSADLGQFEDVPEDDTFSFEDLDDEVEESKEALPNMDIPEELDDISDLLPPDTLSEDAQPVEQSAAVDQTVSQETIAEPESGDDSSLAEPEDDLDFSNLDFDLNGVEEIAGEQGDVADEQAPAEKAYPSEGADMDEDLDFNLDLGGLTIKDEKK